MSDSHRDEPDLDLIHVNVASVAGAYTVGNSAFFRYIVRLGGAWSAARIPGPRGGRHSGGHSPRVRTGTGVAAKFRPGLAHRAGARRT